MNLLSHLVFMLHKQTDRSTCINIYIYIYVFLPSEFQGTQTVTINQILKAGEIFL